MEISVNDIVQVNSSWYGRVIDIFDGDDVRKTRYRVVPLDGRSAERWVNAEQTVSYAALRAAFGGIDSVEDILNANK